MINSSYDDKFTWIELYFEFKYPDLECDIDEWWFSSSRKHENYVSPSDVATTVFCHLQSTSKKMIK